MFVGLTFLMLFVHSVASVPEDWTDCPSVCQCKWISGKKTALCREAGFMTVPNTLNAEMQVLDLNKNTIPRLPEDAFRSVGLINLQRIFLKSSGVSEVHKNAFRELKILVDVDLSDNFIAALNPETFAGNERLRAIYMNGNPMSELKYAQFPKLPHLKSLEFQHCQIKHIHRDAFLHLPALESLSLNGNKLFYLSETVFLPVPNLKTLVLDGNPWKCDCQLRNFRNWLLQSKLYSHSLICTSPTVSRGKHWEEVESGEFACAPNVTTDNNVIQGILGGNATLKCNVYGDPEPNVSWLFNSYTLDNETAAAAAAAAATQDSVSFYVEEQHSAENRGEKCSLVLLFNISDTSAGEYTCKGVNIRGESSVNISLILPKEAVATTMKKDETLFVSTMYAIGAAASVIFMLMLTFVCHVHRRSAKKKRRRNKLKGVSTVSFSDQDKKLLDVSITTTTDRQTGSCEAFGGSQPDVEMLEQSVQSLPLELRDQPVHITIESHHAPDPSSISVFPAPPPEFSTSILPRSTFGNIFISVSVGQEPVAGAGAGAGSDTTTRYPDLIDVTRKKGQMSLTTSTSEQVPYFATLPRRSIQHRLKESEAATMSRRIGPAPQYDNMGPRITADGSSIISLPETISTEELQIPTPPPPPSCSPLTVDYISL